MIPVYRPSIGPREKQYVAEAMDSTWISSRGAFLDRFEREFPAWVGAAEGVAAANGTVALHLAFAALGIGPGDEVIVPTLTYVASVNAIAYTGATPVFVDSDRHHWNLDPAAVERAITPRTRAIASCSDSSSPACARGASRDDPAIRAVERGPERPRMTRGRHTSVPEPA